MQTFCPRHNTLDDHDCSDGVIPCPERVPVDPLKHVIVDCRACDKQRVAPVEKIMKGKLSGFGACQLSECAATVVLPDNEDALRDQHEAGYQEGFAQGKAAASASAPVPTLSVSKVENVQVSDNVVRTSTDEAQPAPSINQAAKPKAPKKATSK